MIILRMPTEPTARKLWIEAIEKHQKFDESVGVFHVCISHFEKKEERRGEETVLIHSSVPSIFPKPVQNVTKPIQLPMKRQAEILNVKIKQENYEGEPRKFLAIKQIRDQVKLVDIDKLKRGSVQNDTPSSSKTQAPMPIPIVKKSIPIEKSANRICKKCADLSVKLQKADSMISSLKATIAKLTAEVTQLTQLNREDLTYMRTFEKCKLCAGYIKKEEMNRHICIDQKSIRCLYCPEIFYSVQKLTDHFKTNVHADVLRHDLFYKCQLCSIAYPMFELLNCHKKSHPKQQGTPNEKPLPSSVAIIPISEQSNIKFFKCGKCERCFDTPKELMCHKRQFTCEIDLSHGTFQCFVCKKMLKRFSLLEKHMQARHDKSEKCKICNKLLDAHELMSHICENDTTIQCEYCDKSFTSTVDLLKHLDNSDEKKKMYRCDECDEFLPMKILRQYHMTQHSGISKPFMCYMCSETFADSTQLFYHERAHRQSSQNAGQKEVKTTVNNEQKRAYVCAECGKSFTTSSTLAFHRYTHQPPRFQCEHCPKRFRRRERFKIHLELHQNIVYICEICNVELKTKYSYGKHLKKHKRTEADRRYECKICSRKFFDAKHLSNHKKAHSTARPFKCKHCDVSYKYSGDLTKHLRTHTTDGKVHECTICTQRFYYYEELQEHMQYHDDKKDKN